MKALTWKMQVQNEAFMIRWGWILICVVSANSKVLTLEEDGKRMANELLEKKILTNEISFFDIISKNIDKNLTIKKPYNSWSTQKYIRKTTQLLNENWK